MDWQVAKRNCPAFWAGIHAQKKPATPFRGMAGTSPGDDLLSRDLSSHYHWRGSVSLPGSEWSRVGPLRCGHQEAVTLSTLLARVVPGVLTTEWIRS